METTRPPGFPGNPPARMPRAPTPARSPPPRPLRCGEIAFRPTHDVGPHKQCMSGLNHAAYGLPVNASRPGSPQAHASLGSGWRPTLAGWDWIPTGFPNKVSKITSRHLVPLDRAFPAHALAHDSELTDSGPNPVAPHRPRRDDSGRPRRPRAGGTGLRPRHVQEIPTSQKTVAAAESDQVGCRARPGSVTQIVTP